MLQFNWPIIGHDKIITYLETIIRNNTVNHGYLFYGPAGIGKNTVAALFAQSILCESIDLKPCQTCAHCRQFVRGIHPDVIYLTRADDKKNITVEQIRDLLSRLSVSSFSGGPSLVVINEADSLSLGASNALLKTLEDPRSRCYFLLLTESLDRLPATIVSRVQTIKFLPIPSDHIVKYLSGQGCDRAKAREIASSANGMLGSADLLFRHQDQLAQWKKDNANLFAIISGDIINRFSFVDSLAGQNTLSARSSVQTAIRQIIALLRVVMRVKFVVGDSAPSGELREKLEIFGRRYSAGYLLYLFNYLRRGLGLLERNANPRLILENILLKF